MKVLLAGASGLIGTALQDELSSDEVRVLGRGQSGDYTWTAQPGSVPADAIEWAGAVVSLNGATLGRLPWTPGYQQQIRASRVTATRALAEVIAVADHPPQVWVSASAVGYYGDRGDELLAESAPPGDTFLTGVVEDWEHATAPARAATRVVLARTGLVLSAHGALAPLALATRLGLGARIGTGQQWWPWISLTDEARALAHLLQNPVLTGPVNLVGPLPATAQEITRSVAAQLHRPHLLVLPAPLIKAAMGRASELLLNSQRVVPQKLLDAGFSFQHAAAAAAIADAF